MLLYYTKYLKGNFYMNYTTQSAAVIISMGYVAILNRRFDFRNTLMFLIGGFLVSCGMHLILT